MKALSLFLAIWGGLTVALLAYLGSKVEIPPAQLVNYRVGSAALAFLPALAVTSVLKKLG